MWTLGKRQVIASRISRGNAQLYVVLRAKQVATRKVAIVMESDYVHKGLMGRMHRWDETHWVLRLGAVPHVNLWKDVVHALHVSQATIKWLWVPSHAA